MESNNIKISEVLLEVLTKVRNIEKLQKLQDLQFKLLLQRIDKLSKTIIGDVENIEMPIQNNIIKASQVQATEEVPIPLENDKEPQDEFNFKTKVLDAPTIDDKPVRTIPVTQIISYNKLPVASADILLTNTAGERIKIMQSNNKGRWQAVLPIGTYILNAKWQTADEFVEFTQSFEVPETASSIITLQMPKALKKIKK